MKPVYRIYDRDNPISIYSFIFTLEGIDSRMYVAECDKHAIVVDPIISDDAYELLRGIGTDNILVLLTHEHYDHISGVNRIKELFDATVICSEECGRLIKKPEKNLSKYYTALFMLRDKENDEPGAKEKILNIPLYSCEADKVFYDGMAFDFCGHSISLKETPGHSKGSMCISVDQSTIFTGDSLLNGIRVSTKLPGGDRRAFEAETIPFLMDLPGCMAVFPGHGEMGVLDALLAEELAHAAKR